MHRGDRLRHRGALLQLSCLAGELLRQYGYRSKQSHSTPILAAKKVPKRDSLLKDAFRILQVRSNIESGMNAAANPVSLPRVTESPDRHDFA